MHTLMSVHTQTSVHTSMQFAAAEKAVLLFVRWRGTRDKMSLRQHSAKKTALFANSDKALRTKRPSCLQNSLFPFHSLPKKLRKHWSALCYYDGETLALVSFLRRTRARPHTVSSDGHGHGHGTSTDTGTLLLSDCEPPSYQFLPGTASTNSNTSFI